MDVDGPIGENIRRRSGPGKDPGSGQSTVDQGADDESDADAQGRYFGLLRFRKAGPF